MEDLINKDTDVSPDYTVGAGYLKDADTLQLKDKSALRLQGVNAQEVPNISPEGTIKQGQTLGELQQDIVKRVMLEGGYDQPLILGKDRHGRSTGDVLNQEGQRVTTKLIANDLLDLYLPTNDQLNINAVGRLDRAKRQSLGESTVEDKYHQMLNSARDPLRAKLLAPTAKQYGLSMDENGHSDIYAGPMYVGPDEDRTGHAKSNWNTGWDIGAKKAWQGAYGSVDMLGSLLGVDMLGQYADSNKRRLQSEIDDLPFMKSPDAFDAKGKWTLDTFSKFSDWAVGNAAMSAPQMLATIASSATSMATGNPAFMTLPAVLYTGETWNDQKDKNAGTAILTGVTMMALDNLGLQPVIGAFTAKPTRDAIIKQLMKKGMSQEVAEKALLDETTKGMQQVALATQAAELARKQHIPMEMALGLVSEGGTEGLQEYVQYAGAQSSFDLPKTKEERDQLQNRILNATAGGAVLGAGFAGGGGVIHNLTTSKGTTESTSDVNFRKMLMDELSAAGLPQVIPSAGRVAAEAEYDHAEPKSLKEIAQPETLKRSMNGVIGKAADWWQNKGVGSLWDKWSNTIMGEHLNKDIDMAALGTLIGASRSLNGGSVDEQQNHIEARIHNLFGSNEELKSKFGGLSLRDISVMMTHPEVFKLIDKLESEKALRGHMDLSEVTKLVDPSEVIKDPRLVKHKDSILHYIDKIDKMVNEYNRITGSQITPEQFLETKPIDKTLVYKDSSGFTRELMNAFGISHGEATQITNSILNNSEVNSLEDSLDELLNADRIDLRNREGLTKQIQDPKNRGRFDKYLSHNIVDNAYSLAARGGASYVNKALIGRDGSKLASLIQRSMDRGNLTQEQAAFIAHELQDWLDMRKGKYHEVTNPYINGALNTLNFLSTVVSLPLAAVSSTVEFAQVYRHLNTPQAIKATKALLKSSGAELAAIYRDIGNTFSDGVKVKPVAHREALSKAGFLREGGIGRRNDILAGYFQKWNEGFFKVTGLTSVTNITRYAKLAIAGDAINAWVKTVKNTDMSDPTQEASDAREHLTRLGIDVDFMTSIEDMNDPRIQERFNDEMMRATHNFVVEAVVHPTQMNRPKFYSDPYLRLFTQFQGYTSTFTANVIPLLVKDLRKTGSQDQTNAAATIAMMVALSMLALYIKDMIKYGESPPDWLKKDKELQRVINQTGLLGTGQRIWDILSDLNDPQQSKGSALARAYRQVSNQAPSLAYINKVDDALSAPDNKGIEKAARLLPIVGTSPQLAKYLQSTLGE